MTPDTDTRLFLRRAQWLAGAWMLVYLPSYAVAYGWTNFLAICNLGVILTCLGLWIRSPVLLSSQAIASPIVGLVWALDVGWKIVTGDFLFGGTAYMWDPQYPLFTRLLSCYHFLWPPLVIWAVLRLGYDRRGLAFQTALLAGLATVGRFLDPALNFNWAYSDPVFQRQFGPAFLHIATVVGVAFVVLYVPMHLVLQRRAATARAIGAEVAVATTG